MKNKLILLLCLSFIFITGCSTVSTFANGRHDNFYEVYPNHCGQIYPATRYDFDTFGDVKNMWSGDCYAKTDAILITSVVILDIPFSILFDTILLPYDIFELRK